MDFALTPLPLQWGGLPREASLGCGEADTNQEEEKCTFGGHERAYGSQRHRVGELRHAAFCSYSQRYICILGSALAW